MEPTKTLTRKNDDAKNTALATGDDCEISIQGMMLEDWQVSTVKIYQDNATHTAVYGDDIPKGSLVDTMTHDAVCAAPVPFAKFETDEFVLINIYDDYTRYAPVFGDDAMYEKESLAWVKAEHADDLKWTSGNNGRSVPPLAQRFVNCVVMFAGADAPVLLSFTKGAIMAARTLMTKEKLRSFNGNSPQTYRVTVDRRTSDRFTWYAFTSARVCGEASEEVVSAAKPWIQMSKVSRVVTNVEDVPADSPKPEAVTVPTGEAVADDNPLDLPF